MKLIVVDPPKGMKPEKVDKIKAAFKEKVVEMEALEDDIQALLKLEGEPTAIDSDTAKNLRKKLVKIRTGTAALHKELKAEALNEGRYLDAFKKVQDTVSREREEPLEKIAKYHENLEAERIQKIYDARRAEMEMYDIENDPSFNIAEVDQTVWDEWLKKAAEEAKVLREHRQKKEAEEREKAEADRIERERLEKENAELREKERIRQNEERLKQMEQDEAERLKKDEAHRMLIEDQVRDSLCSHHLLHDKLDAELAQIIVVAIASGSVERISIQY